MCGSKDIPRAAVGSPRMLERQGLRNLPRKAAGRNSWPKIAITSLRALELDGWGYLKLLEPRCCCQELDMFTKG